MPNCAELGWVGDPGGSQLAIYEMDRLPGENYIIARSTLTHDKQLHTVRSLARFVGEIPSLRLFSPRQSANSKCQIFCTIMAERRVGRFETSQYVYHQHRMLRHIRIPSRCPPRTLPPSCHRSTSRPAIAP